ncbi:hypothetical protein CPC08DRAFT_770281 [Agrocybe pediades]|nr:hypothetical protein CPC08DRAFT_770281 [Agrocybe pediades]
MPVFSKSELQILKSLLKTSDSDLREFKVMVLRLPADLVEHPFFSINNIRQWAFGFDLYVGYKGRLLKKAQDMPSFLSPKEAHDYDIAGGLDGKPFPRDVVLHSSIPAQIPTDLYPRARTDAYPQDRYWSMVHDLQMLFDPKAIPQRGTNPRADLLDAGPDVWVWGRLTCKGSQSPSTPVSAEGDQGSNSVSPSTTSESNSPATPSDSIPPSTNSGTLVVAAATVSTSTRSSPRLAAMNSAPAIVVAAATVSTSTRSSPRLAAINSRAAAPIIPSGTASTPVSESAKTSREPARVVGGVRSASTKIRKRTRRSSSSSVDIIGGDDEPPIRCKRNRVEVVINQKSGQSSAGARRAVNRTDETTSAPPRLGRTQPSAGAQVGPYKWMKIYPEDVVVVNLCKEHIP